MGWVNGQAPGGFLSKCWWHSRTLSICVDRLALGVAVSLGMAIRASTLILRFGLSTEGRQYSVHSRFFEMGWLWKMLLLCAWHLAIIRQAHSSRGLLTEGRRHSMHSRFFEMGWLWALLLLWSSAGSRITVRESRRSLLIWCTWCTGHCLQEGLAHTEFGCLS